MSFTKEQLEESHANAVASMKRLIPALIERDATPVIVYLVVRELPDGAIAVGEASDQAPVIMLSPRQFEPAIPKGAFLQVVKKIARESAAYSAIIGLEAWTILRPITNEERKTLPANMSEWPDGLRGEAAVLIEEKEAEYSVEQNIFDRVDGKFEFKGWSEKTRDGLFGTFLRLLPQNTAN